MQMWSQLLVEGESLSENQERARDTRQLLHIFRISFEVRPKHMNTLACMYPGLHKLWYPVVRDMSTWSKFGAHGAHGDVFLFSNLGALWFSENLIRYSLHVCWREVKNNLFVLQTLLFTAFLVTVLKILTYALGSTWSLVRSGWEHGPQLMQPCLNLVWT